MFADLPQYFWLIVIGVFFASFVQSSVGIGFGLVATPILLLTLDDKSAIQVSILTAVFLVLTLLPSLWRHINFPVAEAILIPATVSLPVGLALYVYVPTWLLKIFAALVVLLVLADLIRTLFFKRQKAAPDETQVKKTDAWAFGFISGLMEVLCTIPGPSIMAYLVKVETSKARIRATIMFIMVFFALIIIVASSFYPGVSWQTWRISILTLPSIFIGGALGAYAVQFISDFTFKILIVALVACMAVVLLISAF